VSSEVMMFLSAGREELGTDGVFDGADDGTTGAAAGGGTGDECIVVGSPRPPKVSATGDVQGALDGRTGGGFDRVTAGLTAIVPLHW
jgi:hypothetical protein